MAAFFAQAGLRHAHRSIRPFIGVDGTYIASWFRMSLFITSGTNANEETLPMAYGLVPIENGAWWKWFFKHLAYAFEKVIEEGFIIILDREKGLPGAIEEVLPNAVPSYCCQHIADNIQQWFGIKCLPLF
jgi:hypothetical protein